MVKTKDNFWKNKRVFITGNTGFKGSWLTLCLEHRGAIIGGYSLPASEHNLIYNSCKLHEITDQTFGDIRDEKKLEKSILEFRPDVILHLAAQPIVKESYSDPKYTYETNVIGTLNLLKAGFECSETKSIIIVTSDKCYENLEWEYGYRESDRLGGHDPYSSSKACCEILTSSFRRSYSNENSANISTVRAGNVIGGGDWSDYRLIPDIIKSYKTTKEIELRYPQATRPWQHVLEPLSGYLILAENLYINKEFEGAFNFASVEENCKPVIYIANKINSLLENQLEIKINSIDNVHEANFLKLDSSKAKNKLDWTPRWDLDTTLEKTVNWYLNYYENPDTIKQFTINQIKEYFEI